DGTATAEPQSDVGKCYAAKISRTEARIDWHKDANSIERKIRAFNPWPICTTSYNGNDLRILRASPTVRKHDASPGEVISIDQNTLLVACGVDALQITTLQKPGGRALTTKEFLNGHKVARGDLLT
ncbi:MAG: methionyl-tRNA formyltransferase, partial [Proteobacteria bacterium]|nr:methionyl-tRNA formyltransferase [Pseudomonadota bacterium]